MNRMGEASAAGDVAATASPLTGRRVLVTRAAHQANRLSDLLRQSGAVPVELPVLMFQPPPDLDRLDSHLTKLDSYDWIVFTSANGVDAVVTRLGELGLGAGELALARLAAIGSSTAARLREQGLPVAFVPAEFVAEAMLAGLIERGISGRHVLLLRAEQARSVLPDGLRAADAVVDVVAVYRTKLPKPDDRLRAVLRQFEDGDINVVTLTSSSTARNLVNLLDGRVDLLNRARIACIGPITAATAADLGLRVDVIAHEYSILGLVAALRQLPHAATHAQPKIDRSEP